MRIREIMSHPVIDCPSISTLDLAARLMWEFDCGSIPVVDNDGRTVGMVTDRDACMAALTQGKALHEIPVTTAMARTVVSCHPEDAVETVERVMQAHRIRRVPIVDNHGRPVGLVSLNDIARLAGRAHRSSVDREVVETLSAVCQPRSHSTITRPAAAGPVALA